MEISSALPPKVKEYGEFSKDLLRPKSIGENASGLIGVLESIDRSLGTIDRAVAKDPNARKAANSLFEIEDSEKKINSWVKMGWRTVGEDNEGNPVNEAFTDQDGDNEMAKLAEPKKIEKHKLMGFLQKQHGYVFNVLHKALGKNQNHAEELDDFIVTAVTRNSGVKKRGLFPESSQIRQEIKRDLAKILIEKSSKFHNLNSLFSRDDPNDLLVNLEETLTQSRLDEEVAKTSEENRIYEFRHWLITTGQNALIGERDPVTGERNPLKIYPTPYYESLVRMAEFLGRKENGIGGSIYTGPPGTGKTRLSVLANQIEGFDTRIIQIHHYSTFIDLIGERTTQLGLDKSTSYQKRLEAAKKWFLDDPKKAIQGLRDFYTSKHASGVVSERSFEDFVANFIVTDEGESIDLENIEALQKGFERYLDYQMAGASLGLETGSVVDEWVNGELLLAMSQGKRALLDELDKAGQYSLGGLLTLLSQSPGETFTVGSKTVSIPSWFRVDATANVVSLNRAQGNQGNQAEGKTSEYLYDRFNVIPVEYPSIVDDLMIAGVRLSDGAGNLKITNDEQWQIIGIYAYLIPALRRAYGANMDMAAVSHRLTAEFCSFLVNPQTRERTNVSVEKGLNLALSKIQALGGSQNESDSRPANKIISNYFSLYQKPSETLGKSPKPKLATRPISAKIVDSALASVLASPFMRAVAKYQIKDVAFEQDVAPELMQLKPEQIARIKKSMDEFQDFNNRSDLGFEIIPEKSDEEYRFTLVGGDLPLLSTNNSRFNGTPEIQALSADAKTAILKEAGEPDKYSIAKFWGDNPSEVLMLPIPDRYSNIKLSADGDYAVATSEDSELYICATSLVDKPENWYLLNGYQVSDFHLSKDGRLILTEDADREHSRVFNLKRVMDAKPDARINADAVIPGSMYDFTTPKLITRNGSNQAILIGTKTDFDA